MCCFLWSLTVLLLSCAKPVLASLQAQHPLLQPAAQTSKVLLNFSSPAPHIFHSLHSLLQQWPQTFYPNGHTLVPGTIPPFTKLYHGRRDSLTPPSPEWLAFDIDMSYGIMGSGHNSFMLTYQTTRPVKALYFDGESAALMGTGQLHAQMLHIYGNVSGPPPPPGGGFRGLWDEYARAIGLCDWMAAKGLGGVGWGYEAVVRMNAGFEVIWCNFTSPSLRLISHLNVTAPLLGKAKTKSSISENQPDTTKSYPPLPAIPTRTDRDPNPTNPAAPPNWRPAPDFVREPFLRSQGWQWFLSATKHYGTTGAEPGQGERRFKVDACRMMSYHAPQFKSAAAARAVLEQRTLNLTTEGLWKGPGPESIGGNTTASWKAAVERLTRRRRYHTLAAVSREDAARMRRTSEQVLGSMSSPIAMDNCSGMDWQGLASEIIDRYAADLSNFERHLSSPPSPYSNYTQVQSYLAQLRDQTHVFTLPFFEYPSNSAARGIWDPAGQLFQTTFARCKFHHTRLLDPEAGLRTSPNAEETVLKTAVEEVMHHICHSTLSISFSLEPLWLSTYNDPFPTTLTSPPQQTHADLQGNLRTWQQSIALLIAYLGWKPETTQCEKKCAADEVCYIPIWPLINIGRRRLGRPPPQKPGRGNDSDAERPPISEHGGPVGGDEDLLMDSQHSDSYSDLADRYDDGYYGDPPPRRTPGPGWGMMDETDLWEPKCVRMEYIMGV